MIPKPIGSIEARDIEALIEDQVREQRTLDYKEELPPSNDKGKRDCLGDVCSLANTGGGDLLYGVRARDGVPQTAPGLSDFNEDQVRLRLESTVRDGLAPRVMGVELKAVQGFPQGPVLVLRVPRSWAGPHMVTFKRGSRFYARSSAGKYQMDIDEIRAAFAAASDAPERIRLWRADRVAKIVGNETPVPIEIAPMMILHLVPLISLRENNIVNIDQLVGGQVRFPPLGAGGWDHRLNLDGLVTFAGRSGSDRLSRAYCQVFRTGRIESVNTDFVSAGQNNTPIIGSVWYERVVIEATTHYLRALRELAVPLPLDLSLTMTGVTGVFMYCGIRTLIASPIDRDQLFLPPLLVEDYDMAISQALRPIFDAVWNAAGMARSFNYDDSGNWTPGQ